MRAYQEDTLRFYDDHVDDYYQKTKSLQKTGIITEFVTHLPKGAKVLDIGCAYGRDTEYLVKRGFDTSGIDLSPNMIKKAKTLVKGARFEVMDVLKLDFPNNHFDGVWCSAILLHLKKADVEIALAEINRVMKKDSIAYFEAKEGKGETIAADNRFGGAKKFYTYFSRQEFDGLVKKKGFTLLSSQAFFQDNKYDDLAVLGILAKKG
jgi:ubiquinone/menaquinone biosynthesis C-methylase UbiE